MGCYGKAVPDLDFTNETSALFSVPSMVISERKFATATVCPDLDLVWETSAEFTAPWPVVSPTSTSIGIVMSLLFLPSLTPLKLTERCWPLTTPVKLMVRAVVPLPDTPAMLPIEPSARLTLPTVTGSGNVATI